MGLMSLLGSSFSPSSHFNFFFLLLGCCCKKESDLLHLTFCSPQTPPFTLHKHEAGVGLLLVGAYAGESSLLLIFDFLFFVVSSCATKFAGKTYLFVGEFVQLFHLKCIPINSGQ